jgi:hypothetical protein
MSAIIEIPCDSIELKDLLALMAPEAKRLVWAILDWQAMGDVSEFWPAGALNLEQYIAQSDHGLILSWSNLNQLIQQIDQLVEGVIVADTSQDQIPQWEPGRELSCELVLEAVDSSIWRVSARNTAILHRIIDAVSKPVAA